MVADPIKRRLLASTQIVSSRLAFAHGAGDRAAQQERRLAKLVAQGEKLERERQP